MHSALEKNANVVILPIFVLAGRSQGRGGRGRGRGGKHTRHNQDAHCPIGAFTLLMQGRGSRRIIIAGGMAMSC